MGAPVVAGVRQWYKMWGRGIKMKRRFPVNIVPIGAAGIIYGIVCCRLTAGEVLIAA